MSRMADVERGRKIGEAVRRLRGEMSQESVAEAMRQRGWKWSQATVWAVEKGTRKLVFQEAADLADVLNCDLRDFLGSPQQVYVRMLDSRLESLHVELAEAVFSYQRHINKIRDSLGPDLVSHLQPYTAALLDIPIVDLVSTFVEPERAEEFGVSAVWDDEPIDWGK